MTNSTLVTRTKKSQWFRYLNVAGKEQVYLGGAEQVDGLCHGLGTKLLTPDAPQVDIRPDIGESLQRQSRYPSAFLTVYMHMFVYIYIYTLLLRL